MTKKIKSVQLIVACFVVPLILSGCVSTQKKVAVVAPAQPSQRLIVHDLSTEVIGKRSHVAAAVDFTNDTGRSLEYVMFKTTAFDSQGREIPSLKSGKPNAWLRIAGPLNHGDRTGENRWEKVWASKQISCFRVEGAEVIYDDSSVEFFDMDQISLDLTVLPPAICQSMDTSLASNE